MSEQSTVGRDIGWYEARHVQMARRLANYRRNIKALQRAHDRAMAWYDAAIHRRARDAQDWRVQRDENVRLRDEIARLQRVPKDRRWNRDMGFLMLGVAIVLAGLFVAALLSHAMLRP